MRDTGLRARFCTRRPLELSAICAAVVALVLPGCATSALDQASRVPPPASPEASLRRARVIYVAEQHNHASHHRLQEAILRSLHRRGESLTVGMEMIDVTQQRDLNEYLRGKISWSEFARRTGFDRGWGRTSPAYRRILAWCRKNDVPVIGLNAPSSVTRKIAKNQKLTPAEARLIPRFPEPPGGFEKFRAAMTSHPGRGSLRRYYEAQRAWDATMAGCILAWLSHHSGTLVVLLGRYHADPRTGVPWYVASKKYVRQVILMPAE